MSDFICPECGDEDHYTNPSSQDIDYIVCQSCGFRIEQESYEAVAYLQAQLEHFYSEVGMNKDGNLYLPMYDFTDEHIKENKENMRFYLDAK